MSNAPMRYDDVISKAEEPFTSMKMRKPMNAPFTKTYTRFP